MFYQQLEMFIKCPICGKYLDPDYPYCAKCNVEVEEKDGNS